ncbi:hypothetical protein ACET3Z_003971 [Daucus carota]
MFHVCKILDQYPLTTGLEIHPLSERFNLYSFHPGYISVFLFSCLHVLREIERERDPRSWEFGSEGHCLVKPSTLFIRHKNITKILL